jgi:virginiamycin B lyase
MSPLNVEEQLRALRNQALGREPEPDAWPRLQRRLRREPTRRAVLVAGLVLVVLAVAVAPGLLARRAAERPLGPMGGTPVVPGRPVVTDRIRLDRPVGYFAIGFGAIWATGQDALVRVDLRTNRVMATIPMSLPEDGGGSIAFGEGAVWVVSSGETAGVVYRVDPAANRVTASIPVRAGAVEVVVAAGTVWVSGGGDLGERFVSRIDARTNKLLSPIPVPTRPGPIRAGLDAVWVVDWVTFARIDPRRGTVTQLGHSDGPIWEVGGGALWGTYTNSADDDDSGVRRVDPDTGRVVARIPIPHGLSMAFGLGTLWVAQNTSSPPNSHGPGASDKVDRTTPGRLYRIDPTTNRVLGQPLTLPRIAPTPNFGVAVGEGIVVVKDIDGSTLTRIDLVP